MKREELVDLTESYLMDLQSCSEHDDLDCIELSRRFYEAYRAALPGLRLCKGTLLSNECNSRLVPHVWLELGDQIVDPSLRLWFENVESLVMDKASSKYSYREDSPVKS